ncbi:MAG: glycosyltransferase family 39 protein, partial [Chloroflexi bacterium]|nr:glycosyltransferase family 39 protein [Chloroflexota bacterium]
TGVAVGLGVAFGLLCLAGPTSPLTPLLDATHRALLGAALSLGILVAGGLVALAVLSMPPLSGPLVGRLGARGGPLLALACAALGQGLLLAGVFPPGVVAYLGAAVLAWSYARDADSSLAPTPLLRRYEAPLVVLVLGVGVLARLYLLGAYPYGVEGDETKWTYSVQQYMLAGERTAWPAYLFFDYAPLSFFYYVPFLLWLGAEPLTGRLISALMSVLALFAFYAFARRASSVPVALIATVLLAVSVGDVSASHYGHVETQVKLWVVLAALFAAWAVDCGHPLLYFLCGLSVAAGLLTYDTFHPMAAVVGLYLGGRLVARWWRAHERWREVVVAGLCVAAPIVPIVPRVLHGLTLRRGAFVGVLEEAGVGQPGLTANWEMLLRKLADHLGVLLQSLFVRQQLPDFFLNLPGPIENVLLLPLLAVGLGWALARARERHNALVLLWAFLLLVPAPVLTGAIVYRVMYPAFPALYVLMALGLWWAYSQLRATVAWRHRAVPATALAGFLVLVGGSSQYVFYHHLQEPDTTRGPRRELLDLVAHAVAPGRIVYVAYHPVRNEPTEVEGPAIQAVVRGRVGIGREAQYYRQVRFDRLLPTIAADRQHYTSMLVVAPLALRDTTGQQVLAAVDRCFPARETRHGRYFQEVELAAPALAAPRCLADAQVTLTAPAGGAMVPVGQPIQLGWQVSRAVPGARVVVERHRDGIVFLTGDALLGGPGWYLETVHADDFTGPGALADNWRSGPTGTSVAIPRVGRYTVWVRAMRRAQDDTHVYLDLGGRRLEIAPPDATPLGTWVWQQLGSVELSAGPQPLLISKDYGTTTRHMAIFIDAVALALPTDWQPDRDPLWLPALDSEVLEGGQGLYRWVPAEPGRYRWRVQALDGDRLIDARGQVGSWSEYQEFIVQPASR